MSFAIKLRMTGKQRWAFLSSRGTNLLRIHAVQFATADKAQAVIDENRDDNPEWEWRLSISEPAASFHLEEARMESRRKARPGEPPGHLAHSIYAAGLGAQDPGRYRRTPTGAPDVPAFVRPGMTVSTSYGTGGVVVAVEGPVIHVASDGREYPHFTIVYVPADRHGRHSKLDHNWINECVAVHGRFLKLLEANSDEVFIEPVVVAPP